MRDILAFILYVFFISNGVLADTFGTNDNQFEIDFVLISGATNPTVAQAHAGDLEGFGIVNNDYRMGVYEITNDQWNKYCAITGAENNSYWTGTNVPANKVSWYDAARFVNWLNISNGYQAAYKFTGTQGTIFSVWDTPDAWVGTNLYRHKDTYYFLPSEDEWFKAAYWNGAEVQSYALKAGEHLQQGDGISGTGWNYKDFDGSIGDPGPDGPLEGPWNVGSGSEELNSTYDMMGNVYEWTESPHEPGYYTSNAVRTIRSASYSNSSYYSAAWRRGSYGAPDPHYSDIGFRVASVPEPCTMVLLGLGGLLLRRK